ncbi:efflux RND transporter periplasmic adaptor subunit [Crenobacter luteus]|uniref:Uncharacterized protein n=1 Tax=Crenobacter luteus TaxID=1452487 RepID=A0A165F1Z8_9NEIS|nr:efflux RND transporter periplasmic adaptor subunit [Crenobacter luteus]KZE30038.1 hypothetical protein AVW16_12970 [Crenobacter luteus]
MRRIFSRRLLLLFAAAVGGVLAWAWWWRGTAVTVEVAHFAPLLETVVSSGRVRAPAETLLGPTQTARVTATPVAEGRAVARGDVLLRLESEEAAAAEAQASANLAAARAARAEAERQLARQRELFAQGFVSRAALDAEGLRAEQARRQADAALAQLSASRSRRGQLTLRAPDDGVLVRRDVDVGDVVAAGRGVLAFVATGAPEIRLDVDERHLARLAPGQAARVAADAYPDAPFDATVARVAAQVDRDRGTVEVALVPRAPPAWLKSGMTVSAELVVARRARALLLPAGALVRHDGAAGVLLLNGRRLVFRRVDADTPRDGRVEIRHGLSGGERVVVAPPGLAPGARAREVSP